MTAATLQIACEPASIPLSSSDPEQQRRNGELLLYFTGYTPEQIKVLADTKGLPLRRTGNGKGTRYVLVMSDYRRWLDRLPQD